MNQTKTGIWPGTWFFLVIIYILPFQSIAQDDLMEILEENKEEEVVLVDNTFKGTRLINGHSVEVNDKGVLNFTIMHRFGRINSGAYDFFGLDNANIRLGLDYSITNNLTVGIGRSSFNKVYDGFVKYRVLRQSSGKVKFPVTVTLNGGVSIETLRSPDPEVSIPFDQKLSYLAQVLIARKFGEAISIQLMPTLIHRNFVDLPGEKNTTLALGAGGRVKISKRIALTAEYYPMLTGNDVDNIYNSLSIGFDIETGGHVFQLMFTNSRQMVEKGFITETDGEWGNGDIHFGFNISRVFYLGSKKKPESW
jgi:hypothetical protein